MALTVIRSTQIAPGRRVVVYQGTDQAAGAEISDTVPTGKKWRLISISYSLVTDANAGTRTSRIVIDDGTNTIWNGASGTTQAASLTYVYVWAALITITGLVQSSGPTFGIPLPLPEALLPAGCRIRTNTATIQVGDNYSAPIFTVEEFDEGSYPGRM